MLVIAMALPVCVKSLADGSHDLSRTAAIEIAKEISDAISEVSHRSIGESRLLSIGEALHMMAPGMEIRIGDTFGGRNYSSIACSDQAGWFVTLSVSLPGSIDGVCSPSRQPVFVGSDSGDVIVSHDGSANEDIIVLRPL
jgi:hypothetical protein